MAVYHHFYDLPVYKRCRVFRKEVVKIVRTRFPKEEKFLLTAQALDAVRSITANIAEGFGRYHYQETIQFFRQSRGSLAETMEHLIASFDDGYIDQSILKQLNKSYKQCLKEINGHIKYLKESKAAHKQ
jgi:four helix bundle protein